MPGNPYYQTPHWRALRKACLDRDGHRCVVHGCGKRATFADHIVTRPPLPYACPADVLSNLRSLCATHDAQVKERKGLRKADGQFTVKGCDRDGWPLDQSRRN